MQLYHGTYLSEEGFTIPKQFFMNGNFFKYPRLYFYGVTRQNYKVEDDISDMIQIFITPHSENDFNNIFWFEVSVPNNKGAFLELLNDLKKLGFCIIDCRGVDTATESTSTVEIIAIHTEFNKDDLEDILRKKYPKHKRSFKGQSIVDTEYVHKQLFSIPVDERNFDERWKFDPQNKYYTINPSGEKEWETFVKYIEPCFGHYLNITSFSEGNFITVKFKSTEEKIYPLQVEFKRDEIWFLPYIINILTAIGVNFKLIRPHNLGIEKNDLFIYYIYFDIVNTKLIFYSKDDIIRIIKAESIESGIEIKIEKKSKIETRIERGNEIKESKTIKLSLNKNENFEQEGCEEIPDTFTDQDIISSSDLLFKGKITGDIEKCVQIAGPCKKCPDSKCSLDIKSKRLEFKVLLDKIDNSIQAKDIHWQDLKDVTKKLYEILSNSIFEPNVYKCGIKRHSKKFHTQIKKYKAEIIRELDLLNKKTENANRVTKYLKICFNMK